MNYLIHLISTFDHNAGTTACGEALDTWTIKYPELSGALQYGYAKGDWREFYQVTCEKCAETSYYVDTDLSIKNYITQTDQEIIDRANRLKAKFNNPNLNLGTEDIIKDKNEALKYVRAMFGVYT